MSLVAMKGILQVGGLSGLFDTIVEGRVLVIPKTVYNGSSLPRRGYIISKTLSNSLETDNLAFLLQMV